MQLSARPLARTRERARVRDDAIALPDGRDLDVQHVSVLAQSITFILCYMMSLRIIVEAECDTGCAANGGTCKAPFKCLCSAGLSGPSCQTGWCIIDYTKYIKS